jgi:hypothetical protein
LKRKQALSYSISLSSGLTGVEANAHKTLLLAGGRTNAQRLNSICEERHLNQQNTTLLIQNKNLKFLSHFSELNRRERDHWEDPGVDGKIMLSWILRKWDVGVWAGLS